MQNQANIKAIITAEDRGSKTVKDFGSNVEGMGTKAKHAFKVLAVGATAATAAAVAFGVSSVKAFMESEDAIAQTNAVLKATKGVAGVTAKQVDKLALSMQAVTKFSDEEVRSAQNLMLTFKAVGKDIFPRAIKAALDMSTAIGSDLQSATTQLGKAMQDPVKGAMALSKQGSLAKTELEHLKDMAAKGSSVFEQQTYILEALEGQYKGSSEAAGKTFAGQLKILQNTFGELQEQIGKVIVEAITPLAQKLSHFIASDQFQAWLAKVTEWIKTNLPLAINYLTTTVWPGLVAIFNATWPIIQKILVEFAKLTTWIVNNKPVLYGLIGAFVALKTAMAVTSAVKAFMASMATVKATFIATKAVIAAPIGMGGIHIAAALAALAMVLVAANKVRDAIRSVNSAASARQGALAASKANIDKAYAMMRAPNSLAVQKRGRQLLEAETRRIGSFDSGGYTGRGNSNQVAGVVHKGEYVVPKSQVDQSTGTPKMGGNTYNVTIQAGVMTGTESDMRKLSKMVLDGIRQIASSQGQTPVQLMESR